MEKCLNSSGVFDSSVVGYCIGIFLSCEAILPVNCEQAIRASSAALYYTYLYFVVTCQGDNVNHGIMLLT